MINSNENLIIIKGEDKTENIDSWNYCNGKYSITFCGGKTYTYNYLNVVFYKDPKIVDIKNTIVLKNKIPLYSVRQVLIFDCHTKISFDNGYKELLDNKDVTYVESVLSKPRSKNCFEYLKQIANTVGLKTQDGKNILAGRYDKIDFIREDCILSDYISGENNKEVSPPKQIIYPFGFNLSQKQATEKALGNSISVIEGPPGTGKTQTILNIIANAVMNGESVAVVSSNNSATKNVLEKLNKYGLGFIAAYLGSGDNKKAFIENQKKELPNFDEWQLDFEKYNEVYQDMVSMSKELESMLEIKNSLSKLTQEIESVKTEQEYFLQYYNETNASDIEIVLKRNIKSKEVLKLLAYSENYEGDKVSLFVFLLNYLRYGVKKRGFYKNTKDRKIAICQKRFYEIRLQELSLNIKQLEENLWGYDFNGKMQIYSENSHKLLKAKLAEKYMKLKTRKVYESDDLWKNSEEFIKDYPVVLSTTYSLRSSLSHKYVYDYVIVDEASQVDVATGALALSCAKKAVIVGDLKQLPNVVNDEMKKKTDEIFGRYGISDAYRYSNHSLLLSVSELFLDLPRTLLREHYRCHPKIIEFCNQKFYNGELIILTENTTDKSPLMVYKTVEGNHSRERVNLRQIDVIEREVIPQQGLDMGKDSIGIVTPYRNQTNYLQQKFEGTNIKADTVDKFQGQERDTIILSTVDDEITDFADNANRLNVAVSRAIKQLIVVTDGNNSIKESNMKDLVEYIEYNNFEVIQSKVYSIFDYLYRSYNEKRLLYLKDKKRIAEYDSENLMYALLEEVLKSEESFLKLKIAPHVPLRMIIRDVSGLEEDAIRYIMAPGTHIDFVLFSKISKKVVLAIEVDGYEFHKKGTRQSERDKLKNAILDKYCIPYIRFKTNASGEKEILVKKLQEYR